MSDFAAFAFPRGVPGLPGALASMPSGRDRHRSPTAADPPQIVYPLLEPADLRRLTLHLEATAAALSARPVADIIRALGRAGARFLDAHDTIRGEALALLPPTSGLSPAMAASVLDGMARDWTEERLLRALEAEFGDIRLLDGFLTQRGRRTMALGPALCVQIVAGSVPGVGVAALLRSLVVKAPTLLKPGLGDVVLPVLFARALREEDDDLAQALAVVYWPGGSDALERAAVEEADVVVAYGSHETVAALRSRTPPSARFVSYHHRVGVGVVGAEALGEDTADGTAADVALAAALFDQRGCVSPVILWIESSGEVGVEDFAGRLAAALAEVERRLPTGELSVEEAAAVHQVRGTAELVAAAGGGGIHHGGDTPWTVIVETGTGSGGLEEASPGAGRVIRVRAVACVDDVPRLLEPLAGHLQTLGVAGLGTRVELLSQRCGRVGVSRVVPFSDVAFPPPWWHHDGRGPLVELVRWVDRA